MERIHGRRRLAVAAAALAAAAFLAGAVGVPWFVGSSPIAGTVVRLFYHPLCHQLPERCLDLGAGPLAVCARCTGLYLGGFLGLLIPALVGRVPRLGLRTLAAIAAPSFLDFGLGLVGLPSLPNLPRLLLALPLGLACGLLLAQALADLAAGRADAG